jgi:hypothetical protein
LRDQLKNLIPHFWALCITEQFSGVNNPIKIIARFESKITVQGIEYSVNFYVVPDDTMSYGILLGRDFILNSNIKISFDVSKWCHSISNSPYASPIVIVRKKSEDIRLCIDYRALNKITVKDNFPTPLIEDHLDKLRQKKYFTSLDL